MVVFWKMRTGLGMLGAAYVVEVVAARRRCRRCRMHRVPTLAPSVCQESKLDSATPCLDRGNKTRSTRSLVHSRCGLPYSGNATCFRQSVP